MAATIQDWMVLHGLQGSEVAAPDDVSSWDVTCMDHRLQTAVALVALGGHVGKGSLEDARTKTASWQP